MTRKLNLCPLLFLLLIAVNSFANKAKTDLTEAVKNKAVTVSSTSVGGLSGQNLRVKIKNISSRPIELRIPPGLHFKAADANAQDLLTVREELLALSPGHEKMLQLRGYCMNANNYSPRPNGIYAFNGYAPPTLKTLADSLNKYQQVAEHYGQMFVWAISDNRSLYDISIEDALIPGATNVMRYVAKVANKPEVKVAKGSGGRTTPSVELFSKTITIAFQNPKNEVASFKIYDAAGNEHRVLYQDRKVSHGVVKYAVGLNDMVPYGSNPVYYLKVISKDGKVLAEKKVDRNTPEENIEPYILNFKFSYTLEKPVKNAFLRVYLENGTLVEEFINYPYLGIGSYAINIKLAHLFPADTKFVAKLEDEKGTLIHKQPVSSDVK